MKLLVLDTMKYSFFCFIVLVFTGLKGLSQTKQEREFRIAKKEFPSKSIDLITPYLQEVKRLKFYKEIDGAKTSYELKFKKSKLYYSAEFDDKGNLEDIEFSIKKADIPSSSLENIQNYLNTNHQKVKIKKIQQQYLFEQNISEQDLKNAFQNLLLPEIRYEIVISGKEKISYQYYELTFDSEGNHLESRRFKASNYNHVLY